ELRREALERLWLPEAAVATLELTRLELERGGEPGAAEERWAELEGIFAGAEPFDRLIALLREDPAQVAAGEDIEELTPVLAATIRRTLRLQGFRGGALPFA